MFQNILNQIKNPVTSILDISKKETLKDGSIKTGIITFIISIVNLLKTVISIVTLYTEKNFSYLSKEVLASKKSDALQNAHLFKTFIYTWLVLLIVIALSALVLFIISKLLKCDKKYSETLSLVSNSILLYTCGFVVATILGFIYAPLGVLALFVVAIYSSFTLTYAFRDSLDIENSDKLVQMSTLVYACLFVLAILLICSVSKVSLSDLDDIQSTLKYLYF